MNCRRVYRWAVLRLILVALIVACLAIVLYTAEFCLWLADPQRKLPPHNRYVDGIRYNWGQPIHNNRFGFRCRQIGPKQNGTFRIMVLGDSITWGAGIAVEQRYTNIMERWLNACPGLNQVEVCNFAVSGGPMTGHAPILERYIDVVRPDLIIVGFCYNDADIKGSAWSPEKERFDKKYGPCLQKLCRSLSSLHLPHIGARTEQCIRRVAQCCGVYPDMITAIDRTYDPNSEQWQAFVGAVGRIKRVSDAHGLPAPVFASLNHGIHLRKPTDYAAPDPRVATFLRWHHQAQAVAEDHGYTVVDFHREIAEQLKGRCLVVNPLDNHPSPELNRLYAETLYPVVLHIVTQRTNAPSGSRDR